MTLPHITKTNRRDVYLSHRYSNGVIIYGLPSAGEFMVTYIESDARRHGNARAALLALKKRYGEIVVHDPVVEARGFWQKMCDEGIVARSSFPVDGLQCGKRAENPPPSDGVWYHGTASDFVEFDKKHLGVVTASAGPKCLGDCYGFNFARSRSRAAFFAMRAAEHGFRKARVIRTRLHIAKPLRFDNFDVARSLPNTVLKGHDAVLVDFHTAIVVDPSIIEVLDPALSADYDVESNPPVHLVREAERLLRKFEKEERR